VTRRDPWTWVGLAVVGVTALVWSFTALSDLARRCGVTAVIDLFGLADVHVAWGLPITVDVLALVATRVWLRGDAPDEAVTYARRAAWAAIGATIAGNGYHGWIAGSLKFDALIVSAVPAVVIGAIVHLAVLVGRPPTEEPADEQPPALERDADAPTPPADSLGGERGIATTSTPTTPDEPAVEPEPANAVATPTRGIHLVKQPAATASGDLVEQLLAAGAGRRRLEKEAGLTEHQARALIKQRNQQLEAADA